MKKKWLASVFAAIGATALATGLTACSAPAHNYSEEWKSDAQNHWHACTDEACEEKDGLSAHTFGAEVKNQPDCTVAGTKTSSCTVCGYEKSEEVPAKASHTWTESVTKQPTTVAGEKTFTCSDCGTTETEPIAALTAGGKVNGTATEGTEANPLELGRAACSVELEANSGIWCSFKTSTGAVYAVYVTKGDNAAVVFQNQKTAVAAGKRFKHIIYGSDRGGQEEWKFFLTTADGAAGSFTFSLIDNENFTVAGDPAQIQLGTEYTANIPEETWVSYNFTTEEEGYYKVTCDDPTVFISITLPDGFSGGYGEAEERLVAGRQYSVRLTGGTLSTDPSDEDFGNRPATQTKFKVEYDRPLPIPTEGSKDKPYNLNDYGDYTAHPKSTLGVFYAFTPTYSGLYTIAPMGDSLSLNKGDLHFDIFTDKSCNNTYVTSMDTEKFGGKAYNYISAELTAGITYYFVVAPNKGGIETVYFNIDYHAHTFTESWLNDKLFHWQAADCGHETLGNYGSHTFDGGVCTSCGYNLAATEGLTFTESDDGTYYIVSKGTATDTEIIIPATYGGKPVKEIAAGAFNSSMITGIYIPSGIEKIGSGAFTGCGYLTKLAVDDINAWANIDFASTSSNPFFAQANGEGGRIYCNGEEAINVSLKNGVNKYAFYRCLSIVNVEVSGGNVGESAFFSCLNLQNAVLGSGVEEVGASAFKGCALINKLTISADLKSTGSSVFSYLTRGFDTPTVTELHISDMEAYLNVTWGTHPFANGAGKLYLNGVLVEEVDLTKFTSVTEIKASAFANCTAIKRIIVDDNVTSMINTAFKGCTNLKLLYTGTAEQLAEKSWATLSNLSGKIYTYSVTEPEEAGNFWHYAADGVTPAIWGD